MFKAVFQCCGYGAVDEEPIFPEGERVDEDVEFDNLLQRSEDRGHTSWMPKPLTSEELQEITRLKMKQVLEDEKRAEQLQHDWSAEEERLQQEEEERYRQQRQANQKQKAKADRDHSKLSTDKASKELIGTEEDDFDDFLDSVKSRLAASSNDHSRSASFTTTPTPSHSHSSASLPLTRGQKPDVVNHQLPGEWISQQPSGEGDDTNGWGDDWHDGGALASTLEATATLDMGDLR